MGTGFGTMHVSSARTRTIEERNTRSKRGCMYICRYFYARWQNKSRAVFFLRSIIRSAPAEGREVGRDLAVVAATARLESVGRGCSIETLGGALRVADGSRKGSGQTLTYLRSLSGDHLPLAAARALRNVVWRWSEKLAVAKVCTAVANDLECVPSGRTRAASGGSCGCYSLELVPDGVKGRSVCSAAPTAGPVLDVGAVRG